MTRPARSTMWLNRFAWFAAFATLLLICSGGMVTSKGVGLAVPDWPTTFGYNMFLFPFSKWIGGIFFEHTHRLIASAVGFLTIILALWLWRSEDREWVRNLGLIAVASVVLQGVLGGLRVTMLKNEIGIFHACLAQAFLGLLVVIAFATTNFWRSLANVFADPRKFAPIKMIALATTIAIYVQLALGATMRHQHRDLALDDLEHQCRRYRHRACRDRCTHAIFRREHLRDLLANPTGASECKIDHAPDRTEGNRHRMKTAAIETISGADGALAVRNRAATDFAQLVKARLTLLVLLTTAVGYYLGAENPISYFGLFHVVFGTALAAASAAAFNQWWERKADAVMHRTKTRPITAGRLLARDALLIGTLLAIAGIIYLAFACNALTASLAALTIILYIFAYTQLK